MNSIKMHCREKAATELLEFIRELDPTWRERIDARVAEHQGETPLQTVGALVGRSLDVGEHMSSPQHPFFHPDFEPAGTEKTCPRCGVVFKVLFPGQQFCTDECYTHRDEPVTVAPPEGMAPVLPAADVDADRLAD